MSLVLIFVMALGIGANTAMFSIVNAFLLRPLPFPEPNKLVRVFDTQSLFSRAPVSYPEFVEWRKQSQTFEKLVAVFTRQSTLVGGKDSKKVATALVSEGFFSAFRISAIQGRTLIASDHVDNASQGQVAVVSRAFLSREGRGPAGVAKSVFLDATQYTIVGIVDSVASDFAIPGKIDVWIPLEPNKPMFSMNPRTHFLSIFGRIKSGFTVSGASKNMEVVAARVSHSFESTDGCAVVPLQESLFGDTRPALLLLLGAVICILLIACANLSNVLLVRTTSRLREFAIRSSLGATWRDIFSQLFSESMMLSVLGGIAGLGLARLVLNVLVAAWPTEISRPRKVGMDWRVLCFALAATIGSGLLSGIAPSLLIRRASLNVLLKDASIQASSGSARSRFRSFLLVAELAFVFVLLVGAALMLRSFRNVLAVDIGFDPHSLLTATVDLPEGEYPRSKQLFRQMLTNLEASPGVASVAATSYIPLGHSGQIDGGFEIEGRPIRSEEQVAEDSLISSSYFASMRIPLIAGRFFSKEDEAQFHDIVIVNQALAREYWPNGSAVGKRISVGLLKAGQWLTIVGVVKDVKLQRVDVAAPLEIYLPYTCLSPITMTFVIRTKSDSVLFIPGVQKKLRAVYSGQAPVMATMSEFLQESAAKRRFATLVLNCFACLAVVLAAIGLYGVVSYTVLERRREFGTRMALGCRKSTLVGLVLGHVASRIVVAIIAGLLMEVLLHRLIGSFLFGVGSFDPLTVTVAAVFLSALALLASAIPAYRASSIPPATALRYE